MKIKFKNIPALRAFKSRNYKLYFSGRAFSQLGTAMQRTAVIWMIYSLTHSEFLIGATIFAEQFPSFLFSIIGGVYADKYNKYSIVKITQILSFVQASALAVLIFSGHKEVWVILFLSVILGIINAFDVPARQALIHEVVQDKEDLHSAISLNSAMGNTAKLLGPVLSGIIIHQFGASICFSLNALSFGAVYLSFILMKLPLWQPATNTKKTIEDLKEGFHYLKGTPSIAMVILITAMVSLCLRPYITLMPVFAKEIFKGNAATYGYISGFIGTGSVVGTLFLASLKKGASLRKFLLLGTLLFGISLICFSQMNTFYLAMGFAAMAGLGQVSQTTISNIIVQTESNSKMRGRVISILIMALLGMLPIGSLLVGALSEKVGVQSTLLIQGILGVLFAFLFLFLLKKKKTTP